MNADELHRQLTEGIRLEQALRWSEAETHYARLVASSSGIPPAEAVDLRLRHANALLVLKRHEEAQREFDLALDAAKGIDDPLPLARALLGAGVFAASRGDAARGEEFLLAALDAFHRRHDPEGIQGEGWALLNLAAIYGKAKRLDLAFVTFDKARERLFAIGNWVGVATAWELQGELRATLGDAERTAQDLHEAMSFYAKEGMTAKVEELRGRLGGHRVV